MRTSIEATMAHRIYLAGIVERGGRILLVRQTPKSQWELPGGPLLQRHPDADLALGEIMLTFGITFPDPEERFIETVYLPDENGHVVYNIYATSDWEGEPEIPIGMAASWYQLDELEAADMREEVRHSILVTFGMREPIDGAADVLKALAPVLEPANGPIQPPLAPLPGDSPPARPPSPEVETPPAVADAATETVIEFARPVPMATESDAEANPAVDEANEDDSAEDQRSNDDEVGEADEAGDEDEPRMLQFPVGRAPQEPEEPTAAETDTQTDADHEAVVESEPDEPGTSAADDVIGSSVAAPNEEPVSTTPSEPEMVIDATRAPAAAREAAAVASVRREQGLDVLRTLNRAEPTVAYERLKAQYPELADDVVDFALGDVWNEPTLDRKQRSLVVVSMLAALGGKSGPLYSHINGALNHGASPDEVVQVMRMVAVYAGFPAALEAWTVMEEVFRARRVAPAGRSS